MARLDDCCDLGVGLRPTGRQGRIRRQRLAFDALDHTPQCIGKRGGPLFPIVEQDDHRVPVGRDLVVRVAENLMLNEDAGASQTPHTSTT